MSLPALALAGCASPDYAVAERDDLLAPPASRNETLGEEMAGEFERGGCLAAGTSRSANDRCEALRAIIAPPEAPVPIPPPPPPPPPSRDDA